MAQHRNARRAPARRGTFRRPARVALRIASAQDRRASRAAPAHRCAAERHAAHAVGPAFSIPASQFAYTRDRSFSAGDPAFMTLVEKLNAYERLMRLDKPIGIVLLLAPALWGLWLAAYGVPDLDILMIFVTGTVLVRSAGCVVNDLADRNFDGHVVRTRERPLAAGVIRPAEAMVLAALLFLLAFVLVLQTNRLTVLLSFIAVALTVVYPFLKR